MLNSIFLYTYLIVCGSLDGFLICNKSCCEIYSNIIRMRAAYRDKMKGLAVTREIMSGGVYYCCHAKAKKGNSWYSVYFIYLCIYL